MQPVAAVGYVGYAQVLARRKEVLDPHRDERPQGHLERPAADIHIVASSGARVQVDAVGTNADAVVEDLGTFEPSSGLDAHVLLYHGELGLDAATLPHIGVLGQTVLSCHDIFSE